MITDTRGINLLWVAARCKKNECKQIQKRKRENAVLKVKMNESGYGNPDG